MVRQWQELFFEKRYAETAIWSPNFVKLAAAYEIEGKQVTNRTELEKSIQEMLQHDGPFLLEVMVGKEENVFPMIPTGSSVSDIRLE